MRTRTWRTRTETLEPYYYEARPVRGKLGLTQQQFAKKLGISVTTVRGWSVMNQLTRLVQALLDHPDVVFPNRHYGLLG